MQFKHLVLSAIVHGAVALALLFGRSMIAVEPDSPSLQKEKPAEVEPEEEQDKTDAEEKQLPDEQEHKDERSKGAIRPWLSWLTEETPEPSAQGKPLPPSSLVFLPPGAPPSGQSEQRVNPEPKANEGPQASAPQPSAPRVATAVSEPSAPPVDYAGPDEHQSQELAHQEQRAPRTLTSTDGNRPEPPPVAGLADTSLSRTGQRPETRAGNGLVAPDFTVGNLSFDQMEAIASNGDGMFAVRLDGFTYFIPGGLRSPADLRPPSLNESQRLSERALPLDPSYARAGLANLADSVTTDNEAKVAKSAAERGAFFLLLSNRLDQLILQRQHQAASKCGEKLEDVARTLGELRLERGQFVDYQVFQLELRDGRQLPL